MQLNITTDYAVRIILYLGITDRITTSSEIAKEMKIPANYVPNIVKKLRDQSLVHATFGPQGGYRLAKDAQDISLLEIINIMEGSIRLNRCLEDDGFCSRSGIDFCAVHQVYKDCQAQMEAVLASKSVAQLIVDEVASKEKLKTVS